MMRSSVLETMNADYVRTARAKGIGESHVLSGHVFKNAFIPTRFLLDDFDMTATF